MQPGTAFYLTAGSNRVSHNAADDEGTHAEVRSTGDDGAKCVLTDEGFIECGDYYLTRNQIEDRSLLPKRVLWVKKGKFQPKPAKVEEKEGGGYTIKLGGNGLLVEQDGQLYARLMPGGDGTEVIAHPA